MKLYLAGGCGEHGRNCFFADCGDVRFLVDCGILAGEPAGGKPHLSNAQISSLDFVFLTHSHADHTGALQWLCEQGYRGPLIATQETMRQFSHSFSMNCELNALCPGGTGRLKNLDITWGRSGHCEGSVWYKISTGGKTMLFSGDYTESTLVYRCDKIRGQKADLAVLDCAYGNDTTTYAQYCDALLETVNALWEKNKLLLFPVPKFGRGLELLALLSEKLREAAFFGDAIFLNNLTAVQENAFWYQKTPAVQKLKTKAMRYAGQTSGILFVSDPQLRAETSRKIAQNVFAQGGHAIMTGTAEAGSYSAELMAAGKMAGCRYPVHLNRTGYELLKSTNHFAQAIAYHSDEINVCSPIAF